MHAAAKKAASVNILILVDSLFVFPAGKLCLICDAAGKIVARFIESATGISLSIFPIGQSTSSIEQTDCQAASDQQQQCGVQRMQAQTKREAAFDRAVRQHILQRDLQ
jgi:hypothetical protein